MRIPQQFYNFKDKELTQILQTANIYKKTLSTGYLNVMNIYSKTWTNISADTFSSGSGISGVNKKNTIFHTHDTDYIVVLYDWRTSFNWT
jgi:hypothetical protein